MKYPSVDNLIERVMTRGKGTLMFKRDLKRAYRQIPVDPGDLHLLGYYFDEAYYFDFVLPMGLRSSAYICQRITDAIRFICKDLGQVVVNFLDDFAGANLGSTAWYEYQMLNCVLSEIGCEEALGRGGGRKLVVPIVAFPNSRLCPVKAIKRMIRYNLQMPNAPCFAQPSGKPITYSMFQNKLKKCITAGGMNCRRFSTPSFRLSMYEIHSYYELCSIHCYRTA